jgi:hypothetical protein
MKISKILLAHSAQQLDNLSPEIICKGERRLDLYEDKTERQVIVSNIDRVISSSEDVSSSPKVIIYQNLSEFVIKSIPEERDGYGRLSPILSYGHLPDEEINIDEETAWVETVSREIMIFARSIEMTLPEETQQSVRKLLEQSMENIRQKRIRKDFANKLQDLFITLGIASLVPIVLGWILYEQIPHMLKPLIQQNPQQIFQTLVVALMSLVTISNVTLVLILKIPSLLMIRRASRIKKKPMTHEFKVY